MAKFDPYFGIDFLKIYWNQEIEVENPINNKIKLKRRIKRYFTIQHVDSIEMIDDRHYRIEGYSLKRVEDNKIRLIKQIVPRAIFDEEEQDFFTTEDEKGKFAMAEIVWERHDGSEQYFRR